MAVGGSFSTSPVGPFSLAGADAFGGAIYSADGLLISVNNTFAANDAQPGIGTLPGSVGYGGAICSTNGSVTLVNTILTNGIYSSNYFGVVVDGGHNLSSDSSCNFTNTGSLNNTDPMLGSLQDNGGPTPTMALLPGSPAIDAGDTAAAPQTDQRGIVRPVGPAADIGAFEYYAVLPACSYSVSPTNVTCDATEQSQVVNVIANYYCDWTAGSLVGWLTLSATNGSGIMAISINVATNQSIVPRQGTLIIAGQTVTVSQAGALCSYVLSATNASYPVGGGTGTVSVVALDGCNWAASSNATWLTISSGANSAGSGTVNYSVATNGNAGARVGTLTIAGQTFTVKEAGQDTLPPSITIASPAAYSRLTNSTVTVLGAAQDTGGGVGSVEYRLENANGVGAYQAATGTTNWSATVSGLIPGTNIVRVHAWDLTTTVSNEVTLPLFYVQTALLAIFIHGNGQVLPNLAGQRLDIGASYLMAAIAGKGYVFSSWSGSIVANTPVIAFLMQSNLVLQANFVPSPVIALQGLYTGLVVDTTNSMHDRSGYFSLRLAASGALTGQFIIGGRSYPVKPVIAQPDGQAEIKLYGGPPKQQVMTAELQFELTNGMAQVSGTLSDEHVTGTGTNAVLQSATWVSELTGFRSGFFMRTNPAALRGAYTLVFPGGDGTNEPAGNGFATVNVDLLGVVRLTGFLADGTPVSQRTALSTDGNWPLFARLYAGHGSLIGWMNFTNLTGSDLNGTLIWTKPTVARARYYPAGFTNSLVVVGSRYIAPPGTNRLSLLGYTNGSVVLSGGELSVPFTNGWSMDSKGRIANTSSNKLNLTINAARGLLQGTVVEPGASTTIRFKGVVVQKQNAGYGYFLGTNQSGSVLLTP